MKNLNTPNTVLWEVAERSPRLTHSIRKASDLENSSFTTGLRVSGLTCTDFA